MKKGVLIVLAILCLAFPASAGEKILGVPSRPGVTIPLYLQEIPDSTEVLLLFPGGKGQHFFQRSGKIRLSKNFLCRAAPYWVQSGFSVAMQGLPSDQGTMFSDEYRTSPEQREDAAAVMRRLADLGYRNIYLVATSRGTLSAAAISSELRHEAIRGVVLTATLEGPKFLRWVRLEKIPYPALFVHHRHDACKVTSIVQARASAERLKASPRVDFVELDGGLPPQSDACEALSEHGFFGIEEKAAQSVIQWIQLIRKQNP
jgi:pimeloyl-ACP methyl ester carboxylesterase